METALTEIITCYKVEGCECVGELRNGLSVLRKGYCSKHYQRFKKYGDPEIILKVMNTGRTKHLLYKTWTQINNRIFNQNTPAYANYGGRGLMGLIISLKTWANAQKTPR